MNNIEEFEKSLRVDGKAESTITKYTAYIKKYIDYCDGDISSDSVRDFMLSLQGNLSEGTINNYRKAISSYVSFAELDIKLPKSLKENKKIPDVITEEQFLEEILPMVEFEFSNYLKIKAILIIYFYTGLRRSEILQLKREQFDLDNQIIKIYSSKTRTEREIILPKKIIHSLDLYFDSEPEDKNAFNASVSMINEAFRKLKKNFPDYNLRPVLLRHSFGTIASDSDVDLLTLADMMGHENLNSTRRYVKISKKKKEEALKKMFKKGK